MGIVLQPYASPATTIAPNLKVTVTLEAGAVTGTDGSTSEAITSAFITEATPIYADVDYIILNGGDFLEQIPGAAIYSMAYAASVLVDDILLFDVAARFPDTSTRQYRFFNRARMEFVKCKVCADLLRAMISSKGTSVGRKLLADFSIDNSAMAGIMTQARPILKDYVECYQYWQKVLFAGGAVDFESPMGQAAVKGGHIPDGFGGIGRGWIADSDALGHREAEYLTGNTMSRPRRYGTRDPLADIHES